jgi:hypothetical protein
MAITPAQLQQLATQAQNNAAFFHGLVFNPANTLAPVQYLTAQDKATFVALNPAHAMVAVIGAMGTVALGCDPTCGDDSCGYTCSDRSCNDTCSSSCDDTCNSSCGHTVGVMAP